jgi:hypothetical protein
VKVQGKLYCTEFRYLRSKYCLLPKYTHLKDRNTLELVLPVGESGVRMDCHLPATAGQFLELQPARKSGTSSPGRNTGFAPSPVDSAALRPISAISFRTQPTLEISISPSWAIQKMLGTLVSP